MTTKVPPEMLDVADGFPIAGEADNIQLLITGHSTQTSDILVVEQNGGTDVLNLDNSGNLTLLGGLSLGTALPVAEGGTGSTTAGGARTNLSAQAQDALLDDIAAITPATGDILYVNGSGDIVNLAAGTNGHVLTLAAGIPGWAAGGGGGSGNLVFLGEATISSDATIEFVDGQSGIVFDSTYDLYLFEFIDLLPATDATELRYRTTADGGGTPTWDSGASDYAYVNQGESDGNNFRTGFDSASDFSTLGFSGTTNDMSNVAGETYNGRMFCFNPAGTGQTMFSGQATHLDSATSLHLTQHGGARKSAAAILGVQFYSSSDNLASGTIRLYGINNA